MSGPYNVVLADPPWQYGDKLRMSDVARSSEDQYDTMSVAEICGLSQYVDVGSHVEPNKTLHLIAGHPIADDALLFLWTTNSMLLDLSAVAVCKSWGFAPKQLAPWVKVKRDWTEFASWALDDGRHLDDDDVSDLNERALQFGMGRIFRNVTEQLVVATKGRYSHLIKSHSERGAFFAPRGEHSAKPAVVQESIERLVPDGVRLELFARTRRPGWDAWGKELEGATA